MRVREVFTPYSLHHTEHHPSGGLREGVGKITQAWSSPVRQLCAPGHRRKPRTAWTHASLPKALLSCARHLRLLVCVCACARSGSGQECSVMLTSGEGRGAGRTLPHH